jgi:energy-coupling factor transport system substrate-specific component
MIVLTAVCAALYGTAIIVFRTPPPLSIRIIGQLLPMTLSLLFGPAAVWGLPLGGVVAGFVVGDLHIGTIFGFWGNFLLGFLPYSLWTKLRPISSTTREIRLTTVRSWLSFLVIAVTSAFAASVVIAWPLDIIGVAPFSFLAPLIGVQDAVLGVASVVLLLSVYNRVKCFGLLWWDVLDEADVDQHANLASSAGAWLVVLAAVCGFVLGIASPGTTVGMMAMITITLGAVLMW